MKEFFIRLIGIFIFISFFTVFSGKYPFGNILLFSLLIAGVSMLVAPANK